VVMQHPEICSPVTTHISPCMASCSLWWTWVWGDGSSPEVHIRVHESRIIVR
jgi:hypothetical protein